MLFLKVLLGFANNPVDTITTFPTATEDSLSKLKPADWYDKLSIRGYAQLRYNRLGETNPDLRCDQCDRSWGGNGGFFFRRIRIIFFGNVHERVYVYIQPDFASQGANIAQIRDAYFDLALNESKTFRLRVGQSKVPFGFENLQSSQNRLPLDRNDGLNSAVANERDIGVFGYWAPAEIRERFAYLVRSGLKGSGDYGVVGLGLFNGQTANNPEANDGLHVVGRVTYPFQTPKGQFIEASLQGYTGEFVIRRSAGIGDGQTEFRESRAAATFVYYPQPFGIQMEYNVGYGPEFNPNSMEIETRNLHGGYLMSSYYLETSRGLFIPFFRWHVYNGGKKHETDATKHRVNEQELGFEWQPHRNFELVMCYTFSDRTFENFANPMNRQMGRLLRIQAQVNF
ncbi:MAG: OprO/OprP family phosphate-selective porin [Schleiferiaceae bacterium]|nr:OprO/OprP family phosphate-selective porin [Schleiferiaceae bacterium]